MKAFGGIPWFKQWIDGEEQLMHFPDFSMFIPIAFITTIPSEVFLGISQSWKILLEVIVAMIFLFTSRKFWIFALKFYSSASS